jgi:signal transduction histidine kinase
MVETGELIDGGCDSEIPWARPMKQKLIRLSKRYASALLKHLKPGPGSNLNAALELGREAVGLGMETLDLAQMHEQALMTLGLPPLKRGPSKQAAIFFTEANSPIEETHRGARQTQGHLVRLTEALGQRTMELAATHRQLKRHVVRCKVMENAATQSGKHHDKCLEESLELQKRLRQLTHQVMSAQENERKKISHELQDEIAQTLLGINVRLLSLKHDARNSTKGLKNEIASTQRLVVESAKSVRRFARELDVCPQA